MTYNLIRARHAGAKPNSTEIAACWEHLKQDGWVVLRGFDMSLDDFNALTGEFCKSVTFDPAREISNNATQKVDAGLGEIGLHIENGNTPVCPDIVAFFARTAAFEGSQTTICDGSAIFDAFDDETKAHWLRPITVKRNLPEDIWKRYLTNEHPGLSDPSQITPTHIKQFQAAIPGQSFEMKSDGSLDYMLQINPVRESNLSNTFGFANAILGPSHNYERPSYTFADRSVVSDVDIAALRALAETHTHEINWNDGDIAILDNTRVMHGRRGIKDSDRELFIGMGRV
ncbi:MAG: TauD/TfdA family dioxygenase [Pseudoruegeria sp.]